MAELTKLTRVLIVGSGGMLGHRLVHEFHRDTGYSVHATVRRLPDTRFRPSRTVFHEGIDLAFDTTRLRQVLTEVRPHVIVNAAGVIKQRSAAADPDVSMFINGAIPHILAVAASELHSRLIHVSTDCVFRGDRPAGPYVEADAPDAADVYGRSKAVGEVGWGGHLTVRTSIIGFELTNHLGLLGWLFSNPAGSTIGGYKQAIYSGLPTATLARTVRLLVERYPDLSGIYHVASEPITKYELLQRLNVAFSLGLEIMPDAAVACNRQLDDSRFRAATGLPRPAWSELVEDLVRDHGALPYDTLGYRSGQSLTHTS
jgi:dTDP-4-dehydrorhamnose reductase